MTYPREAYREAYEKGGSDHLRGICCQDPEGAYWYALTVDKSPREETRKAACKYPYYAYLYARDVDICCNKETRRSCYKSPFSYTLYLRVVSRSKYHEELRLIPYIRRLNND